MKLLSSYFKELKIAARGFYFYIEIGFAIILLLILMLAVETHPTSSEKEYLFYDAPTNVVSSIYEAGIEMGTIVESEPTTFELGVAEFEVTNKETGEAIGYNFDSAKTTTAKTFEIVDPDSDVSQKIIYIFESEEDLMRLSYSKKIMGASVVVSETFETSQSYYLQGYETERLVDLFYVMNSESLAEIAEARDNQVVRTLGSFDMLNNRQNMVPIFIVFMGSLMGFFIVMSYIFLDKSEGVIRAFAVTPSSVWKYLLSKTMIIMTTVCVSSSIIAIPVMGLQPNYLLFYPFLIISTFTFAALGLLVSSFFDTIAKSFGAMYALMIVLLIPVFSYLIPSFDPVWLRFFPTYPLLQGFKEILIVNGDIGYVLTYSGVFLVGGILLFLLANYRFKKTLTL